MMSCFNPSIHSYTCKSARAGYVKFTSLNSISPSIFSGLYPCSDKLSISEARSITLKTLEPAAFADATSSRLLTAYHTRYVGYKSLCKIILDTLPLHHCTTEIF